MHEQASSRRRPPAGRRSGRRRAGEIASGGAPDQGSRGASVEHKRRVRIGLVTATGPRAPARSATLRPVVISSSRALPRLVVALVADPRACWPPAAVAARAPRAPSASSAPRPAQDRSRRSGAAGLGGSTYRRLYSLAAALQDPGSAALSAAAFRAAGRSGCRRHLDLGRDRRRVSAPPARWPRCPTASTTLRPRTLGGHVYLFGGGQFTEYDHILAFDPSSGAVSAVGTLPRPSSDVAVAGDGSTAYVVGGYDGTSSQDTILSYRPGLGTRVAGHLPVALRYAAVTMAGRAVIIAGGSTPAGSASAAIYRFDPATGQVPPDRFAAPAAHPCRCRDARRLRLRRRGSRRGHDQPDRGDLVGQPEHRAACARPDTLPAPTSDAGVIGLGVGDRGGRRAHRGGDPERRSASSSRRPSARARGRCWARST